MRNSFTKSSLVVLFILLIMEFYDCYKPFCINEINIQYLFNCNLYIGVLVVRPSTVRISSLLKAWGYEFASKPGNEFKIFTPFNENKNSTYWKHVNLSSKKDKKMSSFRLMFYSNFASARDFYENTTLNWYLRTTYDCFIHLPHLYHFIHELNTQYDPTKDIVFKGDHTGRFIHGGPGWIMSRAAVYQYLKMEEEMETEFLKNGFGDDVNIMMFPQKFNLTFNEVYTPEFVGWPVRDSSYSSLIESNFTYSNVSSACGKNMFPVKVNSIIIWHNGCVNDYVNTIGKKIINEAPDFLGLHFFRGDGGEFCRFNDEKINETVK